MLHLRGTFEGAKTLLGFNHPALSVLRGCVALVRTKVNPVKGFLSSDAATVHGRVCAKDVCVCD